MEKKIRVWAHDDLAQKIDDMFDFWNPVKISSSYGIHTFNSDEYDLVPKKSYWERKLKEKEEELSRLKQRKENDIRFYESREKSLQLEIEEMRRKIT
jgi:hypothetical protein